LLAKIIYIPAIAKWSLQKIEIKGEIFLGMGMNLYLCCQESLLHMTTTLHFFNPDNDLALANNNEHFQSPASALKMGDDLSTLPAWWAEPGDSVLVASVAEAQAWAEPLGALLPSVRWYSWRQEPDSFQVEPWGWNPALRKRLKLWGMEEALLPSAETLQALRALSSRRSAVTMLPSWSALPGCIGRSCFATSEAEVEAALQNQPRSLLKAPFSCSGKGLRWGAPDFPEPLRNWCRRTLKAQGGVVVEPLYQRVVDFAVEWKVEQGVATYAGLSLFDTDENGAYQGNRLLPDAEILQQLQALAPDAPFSDLLQRIPGDLSTALPLSHYSGYLGIDMMLCRSVAGEPLRLHPCVEINLRRSMGWVARHLFDRYLHPSARGLFRIDYQSDGEAVWQQHLQRQKDFPLCIEEGRICSGYLSLAPVTRRTHYTAYLMVHE
jgi:hypothetical protein